MACEKCDFMPTTKRDAHRYGLLIASVYVCDKCWEDFTRGLESGRRQFGALLDKGLTREQANAEMLRRIRAVELK